MARYSEWLDRRVDVRYRAGDIVLTATGRLAADSGRSIFLEDRHLRGAQRCTFRWEIPYECILAVTDSADPAPADEYPPEGQSPARSDQRAFFNFRKRPRET
jgi:hypothetical protein